ncbi:DNA-binding response regulator [Pseudoclavibacter endophyticus]|uniref:response regulator transcription factor n=1 Tax=Pseudoclavibacter endophyticus TaxID=1778590 RepID=UPI0019A2E7BE|nr:response regulator transcription factor [Pseudoclavibacter endophyticus]GGA55017.1 DNA-binding response regulator [Pseudoclavibacter endophyticus]
MTVRVLIADDQELLRASLETVLGADERIDVIANVDDGDAAIEACRAHRVDVALMDVRMPRVNGIEATREIVALAAEGRLRTRVLVLTTFDLDEYVFAAIEAGASGFLTKDARPAELVDAICRVHDGDAVVAPRATAALLQHVRRAHAASGGGPACPGAPGGPTALAPLSPRERDVVSLLAAGASNDEIGERLYLTTNTVKTHVKSILAKLGLPDRIHVVIWAYEHGVVRPGEGVGPS